MLAVQILRGARSSSESETNRARITSDARVLRSKYERAPMPIRARPADVLAALKQIYI